MLKEKNGEEAARKSRSEFASAAGNITELVSLTYKGTEYLCSRHANGGGFVARWRIENDDWKECKAHADETAYVGKGAAVLDNATVRNNAKIKGNAIVFGNADVSDFAEVYGDARVYGFAKVLDNAKVFGEAQVYDSAQVYGNSEVREKAEVYGCARVEDKAQVYGRANISGEVVICHAGEVCDQARFSEDECIASATMGFR